MTDRSINILGPVMTMSSALAVIYGVTRYPVVGSVIYLAYTTLVIWLMRRMPSGSWADCWRHWRVGRRLPKATLRRPR